MNLFEDLGDALLLTEGGPEALVGRGRARVDLRREDRKGVPEVIARDRFDHGRGHFIGFCCIATPGFTNVLRGLIFHFQQTGVIGNWSCR